MGYAGWYASPLPGAVAVGVGADRPETGAPAENAAVAQDGNAAVAPLHAIEQMHVKGIKPVFRGPRLSPSAMSRQTWLSFDRSRSLCSLKDCRRSRYAPLINAADRLEKDSPSWGNLPFNLNL
jgi:hypothetical protein